MKKKLQEGLTYFDVLSSNDQSYLNAKKVVISDCDGVLTDGNSIYTVNGKEAKIFGAYDTEMITFMKSQGWEFIFVSRDPSGIDITKARIEDMHAKLLIMDGPERANLVKEYNNEHAITLFIGDSLSDIQAISLATYSACPLNAADDCKDYVDYQSFHTGGHGALGDILMHFHKKLSNFQPKGTYNIIVI